MSCDKEDVPPKLHIVLITPGEAGARQWHLLNEHGEAVAGGGQVQLQVTFELPAPGAWQQARVEGEHTDHLLLHIDPRLAAICITSLVQSEKEHEHRIIGWLGWWG